MKFLWVPFKPQIGKLLKKIIPNKMVVPIFQGRLKGKKWIINSGNIEYALGSYEFDKVKLFEKLIKKGDVIYDIGANVGFYTLLSSELVKETGKVIAFEPLFRNIKYIKKHLKMNNCTNVILFHAAVSDTCGVSSFKLGSNSLTGHISEKGSIQIKTLCIDELLRTKNIPPPNYLKIDVEGAELLVLKGAKLTLSKYKPKIFLAIHNHKLHEKCKKYLHNLGYNFIPFYNDNLNINTEIFAYYKKVSQDR